MICRSINQKQRRRSIFFFFEKKTDRINKRMCFFLSSSFTVVAAVAATWLPCIHSGTLFILYLSCSFFFVLLHSIFKIYKLTPNWFTYCWAVQWMRLAIRCLLFFLPQFHIHFCEGYKLMKITMIFFRFSS